jgi:hypothetical protein
MLIKPLHGLSERLFLRKLLTLDLRISPNRKPVIRTRVQSDLVRHPNLPQNLLGFVSILDGEDGVVFGGCDREGARDGGEFGFFDEGGVRDEADVYAVFVVTDEVLIYSRQYQFSSC